MFNWFLNLNYVYQALLATIFTYFITLLGAAIVFVSGDLSLTISGMSLAAIFGILLNSILPGEKKPIATLVVDARAVKTDMNKLKRDIKDELTVELKEDILKTIREEMNKTNKKKK